MDYRILFGDVESPLSARDKTAAFNLITSLFAVSADGTYLEDANCGNIAPGLETVDLNGDGSYEIFFQWGNLCTSGMTGRNIALLEKGETSEYFFTLGFPAASWTALETRVNGWPDLSFGGPGLCPAIWTRTVDGYAFKCNIPQDTGSCPQNNNLCPDF
ncbi:MAG: hypothetical protein R3F41_14215 [Gammaproteobacteria bacterium]|nr:hypothetical protein [Pseudomonadales bacterium]